ncbi:SDR family NAD(P)-dependent oxidoreductase [Diaphorobacter caeni]|uniref:SDR family NAD(P)-dependent oxidoreductase n=1 Tax=Diaphorobacter caeni TaxID=2784387 RepID=UPI00188FEFFC|nr:glucose 1-dehydrogenase [Diaphorobacter caeni]MBF5007253.1 glucose 1-dehydrogenase [Diaphorobacter caeni]
MYVELKNRVVLVTGGASGLGWATAQAFSAAGARVAIADLSESAARSRAEELGAGNLGLVCDVSDEQAVDSLVHSVVETLGSVDVVVNSAGIPDTFLPTVDQEVAQFRKLVDVHLTGTYMVSRAAAKHMLRQRRGVVLNISSIAGVMGLTPRNAYSAAKAGISMLTRTMGCEWIAQGVRVNAVAPGYMMTPFLQQLIDDGKLDAKRIFRRTPAGRFGTAKNIADAMLFLASDSAEFITGVTLPVDGGYMAWGAASDACAVE